VIVGDVPVALGGEDAVAAAVFTQRVFELAAQLGHQLPVSHGRRGRHRDGLPVPEFPVALPVGVVGGGVVGGGAAEFHTGIVRGGV